MTPYFFFLLFQTKCRLGPIYLLDSACGGGGANGWLKVDNLDVVLCGRGWGDRSRHCAGCQVLNRCPVER